MNYAYHAELLQIQKINNISGKNKTTKVCQMKPVNNQYQLQLRDQVHVYDGENSKSIESDEKVLFLVVKQSIAVWSTMYILYVQLLKKFQENWHV